MKIFKTALLMSMVLFVFSCGDDAGDCVQADWVGTYAGTVDCDGETLDATVTVTASGDSDILVSYEDADGFETSFNAMTPDGCSTSMSSELQGVTATVNIDLDGDKITIEEEYSTSAASSTCNVEATKN